MSKLVTQVVDEWGTSYSITGAGYGVLVAIMIVILLAACYVSGDKKKLSAKQLAFCAMAIALAMITSYMKLIKLPMGGSATLFSMLFICLIGYWYGLKVGLMTAVAYGLLQLISDPYIISLPQMLVDYIFAFGALGLSGVFSNAKHGLIKGYLLGVLGRYFFSFLSGMIFFGSYAADYGMSAPIYSLAYNGAYLMSEAALTLVLLAVPAVTKAFAQIKTMALSNQN